MQLKSLKQYKNINIMECKQCKKPIIEWSHEVDCFHCDEGTEEREAEFGEGYYFAKCRFCNGKGVTEVKVDDFCSDECITDYLNDQQEW